MFKRVIIIILDACGVGELPDAEQYGDRGAATVPNVAEALNGLDMPNCRLLGLGNIVPIKGINPAQKPRACYGKMAEKSAGKDSTSGHWEIGGIIVKDPFPTYPDGFPPDLVKEFENKANIKVIGNKPASGTEIIKELGEKHLKTGNIILYTSADSVFQLAAHEDKIPVERLYEICQIARDLLKGEHAVGRVIARPFVGEPGNFSRTANRKDFSRKPETKTFIDLMHESRIPTVSIGKIYDLYAHRGFSKVIKTKNNEDVLNKVIAEMPATDYGLIYANLVDFDMLWGHRNNYQSFGAGLEYFDSRLPEITGQMNENDLLIITADHGCDPTLSHSTDHTREYVPLLAHHTGIDFGADLGVRDTFADIAQTLAEIYNLDYNFPGKSFLDEIKISIER